MDIYGLFIPYSVCCQWQSHPRISRQRWQKRKHLRLRKSFHAMAVNAYKGRTTRSFWSDSWHIIGSFQYLDQTNKMWFIGSPKPQASGCHGDHYDSAPSNKGTVPHPKSTLQVHFRKVTKSYKKKTLPNWPRMRVTWWVICQRTWGMCWKGRSM